MCVFDGFAGMTRDINPGSADKPDASLPRDAAMIRGSPDNKASAPIRLIAVINFPLGFIRFFIFPYYLFIGQRVRYSQHSSAGTHAYLFVLLLLCQLIVPMQTATSASFGLDWPDLPIRPIIPVTPPRRRKSQYMSS